MKMSSGGERMKCGSCSVDLGHGESGGSDEGLGRGLIISDGPADGVSVGWC
jgi:hypothetical protein